MAFHHNNMPICWLMIMVMIVGTSVAFDNYPDSVYSGYDMVGSCQRYYSYTQSIGASEGALVYSTMGSTYLAGTNCQYIFSTVSGRLLVNAEKMGLHDTGACLTFYESSNSIQSSFTENGALLAKYCGNTLFQVNTTLKFLKIQFAPAKYTEQAEFRLVVTPFFETGTYVQTFDCDDGFKINKAMQSDGHRNCPDSSDEKDVPAFPCSSRMLSCGESGPCIAKEWKCDRFPDCPNASDEEDCVYKCLGSSSEGVSSKLECRDMNGCYSQYQRCRGYNYLECADGSENTNCDNCDGYQGNSNSRRRTGSFFDRYCPMTRTCLTVDQLCDGVSDCPNGADEDYTLCHPSIYWYWTGGQLAGLFIGFIIFAITVTFIVAVVHKKSRKQEG